jgi:hypothetical protein
MCFAAGQSNVDRRTADIVTILEGTQFSCTPPAAAAAAAATATAAAPGGSGYAELKNAAIGPSAAADCCTVSKAGGFMGCDIVFVLGDLNYRIEGDKADIQALVAAGDWAALQSRDQVLYTAAAPLSSSLCCLFSSLLRAAAVAATDAAPT